MKTAYRGRYVTTITAEHVHNPRTLGRDWYRVRDCFGQLMARDIGKQVWETSAGVYQAENDAQVAARAWQMIESTSSDGPMREHVIRYVITYVNKDGQRTLAHYAQGRFTYATADEAEKLMAAVTGNNSASTIRQLYGDNPRFEVRPCPCYPGHFDPQTCWFD
jgi:hypothetical protein